MSHLELPPEPSDHGSKRPATSVRRTVLFAVAGAVAIGAWGVVSRVHARTVLGRETVAEATPAVVTVKPTPGSSGEEIVLPGNVQAFFEAPIYARTSGYLKAWYTDIGTPVKRGQVLADIDSPEVDQQLKQAEADLATADANYQLAKTTDQRWQGLLATESVSKQDADQRGGDAAAKKAALQSAAANVARLHDLESFKHVLAPFDGVVTLRSTDIGALINAGQNPGNALFRVADLSRLRVYVSVPQPYAAVAVPGMGADLLFAERPGERYPAKVAFTARALDPNSRTLQVELQIDNVDGKLFPGAYAEVHFKLPAGGASLQLPVNAVLFRASGLQVAAVDRDHRVHLRSITQGRDFGNSVEVLSGIGADDEVILNPPDSITEGDTVRVVTASAGGAAMGGGHGP